MYTLGSANRGDNQLDLVEHEDRLAKSISFHPRYSGVKRLYNDIALIHVKEEFELRKNILPIGKSNF